LIVHNPVRKFLFDLLVGEQLGEQKRLKHAQTKGFYFRVKNLLELVENMKVEKETVIHSTNQQD